MQVLFGFAQGKSFVSSCPGKQARFWPHFGLKMPFFERFACANLSIAF
jgi:hypothetical protein